MNMQYSSLMKRPNYTNESECLIHYTLISTDYPVQQTLLLNQPRTYRLPGPNLKIMSVTRINDGDLNIFIYTRLYLYTMSHKHKSTFFFLSFFLEKVELVFRILFVDHLSN